MHHKAAKLSKLLAAIRAEGEAAEFEIRDLKLKLKKAEYHYRFALKLRKNFPLSALNLGALQYVELNQLAPALETYKQCGFQMDPSKAKSFNQHVSTQVECLISGSRILLAQSSTTKSNMACSTKFTNKLKGAKIREEPSKDVERKRKVGAMAEQTLVNDDDGKDDVTAVEEKFTSIAEKGEPLDCVTLLKWTDLAKAKANQVVSLANVVSQDPNKQLATIHWIRAHCICGEKENQQKTSNHLMVEPQEDRNDELKLAFEYAKRSQVSIDSSIYISYVDDLLIKRSSNRRIVDQSSNTSPVMGAGANLEPEQVLKEAIYLEHQKMLKRSPKNNNEASTHSGEEIAKLYLRLAKLMITRSNLKQMDKILALSGHFGAKNFNLLSQAAQVGYETKQFERSEKLYLAALELVMRDSEKSRNGRKLASAHANLGAIVQVRGRLEDALAHYRKALDYDPNNRIAATNLSKLVQKVGSKLVRRK